MSSIRGDSPLSYRRLGRAELDLIASLDLDPDHVERFLGPIAEIMTAVRRGPAHQVVAIEVTGVFAGFYIIHPAPNDSSCWWLGWFAVDRNQQGHGYGSMAMATILQHLGTVPTCRRVRLLVAADNLRARRIYHRAGFRLVDRAASTSELVLELVLPSHVTMGELKSFALYAAAVRARRVFYHRRLRLIVGPHPAWVIGVERGPPVSLAAPLGEVAKRRARAIAKASISRRPTTRPSVKELRLSTQRFQRVDRERNPRSGRQLDYAALA